MNTIFESSAVKLDPFHAIQRFTSKIPKKGIKGSPIRRLRSRIVTDFKLVIRDPTDHGKKRTKPTPSREIIKTNIVKFLNQWKDVEYNGTKLIPQCALDEINKLLIHVEKGCLSDIPPSGGTSRNEGLHSFQQNIKEIKDWHSVCHCTAWNVLLYLERETIVN